MLHLDIHILAIKFYANIKTQTTYIQLNDGFVARKLEHLFHCQSSQIQSINEKVQIDIKYTQQDNRNLKVIFYYDEAGHNVKCAEACINLAFYIDNNLPSVFDKISIQNKFDNEAYLEFSLTWTKTAENNQHVFRQNSPIKEERTITTSVIVPTPVEEPQIVTEKRTIHSSYAKWHEHQEELRIEHDRRIKERIKSKADDETVPLVSWEDSLRKPEVRLISPKQRYQTPKVKKCDRMFRKEIEERKNDIVTMGTIQENLKQIEKNITINDDIVQNNRGTPYEQRIKSKQDLCFETQEDRDIQKETTRQKPTQKRTDDINLLSNRYTMVDNSNKTIEQLENDNLMLKNANSNLLQENNQLSTQLKECEQELNIAHQNIHLKEEHMKQLEAKLIESNIQNAKSIESSSSNIRLHEQTQQFQQQNQQYIVQIEKLNNEITNYKQQVQLLQLDLKRNQNTSSSSQYPQQNQSNEVIEGLKEVIRQKQQQNEKLQKEYQQLQQKMYTITNENESNQNAIKQQLQSQQQVIYNHTQIQQQLNSQLDEMEADLQSKIKEIAILNANLEQFKSFKSSDSSIDIQKVMQDFSQQLATLQQEKLDIYRSQLRDQVQIQSLSEELEWTKNLSQLNEDGCKEKERELFLTQEKLRQSKQNIADVLNTVLEMGGTNYLEQIERSMTFRNLTDF